MMHSTLSQLPGWLTLLCFAFVSSILLALISFHRKAKPSHTSHVKLEDDKEPRCYPAVETLHGFDWQETEPVKIRPFKPKYNLTMSIQDGSVNDFILMDRNYLNRVQLRKEIMTNNPEHVLAAETVAKSAVDEFYTWLLRVYLPTRYPRMFQLKSIKGRVLYLHNLPTNEHLPLTPPENPLDSLRILGGLVDEDFLFLLPSDDGDGYTLKAFVTCFPNGFDTLKKLNLKLRDIHKPVPHYKEKLEKSMDRYFDKIKVGKFMKRANWAIQPNDHLFKVAGNHLYEGDDLPEEKFDMNKMRLRVERQYLHRLPQSRALLFSFKTLLYTLPEIKSEGLAEDLVGAIDGLRQGNAPGFHLYKRAAVWGEFVKAYLRE